MKSSEHTEQKNSSNAVAHNLTELSFSRHPVVDTIQTSLTIGQPGDKYEQEADRFADQVMSIPDSQAILPKCADCEEEEAVQMNPMADSITPWIQTQPIEEEEEELQTKMIQLQPIEEEEEEPLQTKPNSQSSSNLAPEWMKSKINANNGNGSSLPDNTRSFMESRFGSDFSGVKVHTDSSAIQMNRSLNALAFTTGRNIYFNSGKFNPESASGKRLLAHELTHIIQQSKRRNTIQRFVTCETADNCPNRERGEMARSRSTPHQAEIYDPATFGILISNFAIDDHIAKPDLASNTVWTNFITTFTGLANDLWEIIGYTDCRGEESRNTVLRINRATEIFSKLLAASTSGRVGVFRPAPLTQCIESNTSESGRKKNRSVLIRRIGGSTGPTPPTGSRPIGPVRPGGTPLLFCVPYTGITAGIEAAADRLMLETVWLNYASITFGTEVHNLWTDYLNRPKGASLTPRVFRGAGNVIVDAFRTDPATSSHKATLHSLIQAAVARSPEATVPFSGRSYLSPRIPLGTILPAGDLTRNIVYTNGHNRIPGNIAGGASVGGAPSSDAGPDLRLFTGTVQIARRKGSGSTETKRAMIDLQLQVIDAIDFCPGNPGGFIARSITIPMSRLEATPTERTYDLPFHVFVNWSENVDLP